MPVQDLTDIREKKSKDDKSKRKKEKEKKKDKKAKDDQRPGKEESHPAYLYGVLLKALDKHQKPLQQSVHYVVSGVIRDMRMMAKLRPTGERDLIIGFIDRYDELYKSGTGGGGGDDQRDDILQGP